MADRRSAASNRLSHHSSFSFFDITRASEVAVLDTPEVSMEKGKSKEAVKLPSASATSAVINMAHTIMGSGVLALPKAVADAGLVWGLVFLALGAVLGTFSLFILGQAATRRNAPSFTGMGDMITPGLSVLSLIHI